MVGIQRSATVPRRLVVVLAALSAMAPISTDVYLPTLPSVGDDLGVGPGPVAATLTASVVGLGLGQLVAGPLSDRFGRRAPLLGGLAVFAVASLVCALAPSLGVLVAARLVQALGGSAGIALARAIARDLRSGEELARLFATLIAFGALAPVVGPLAGAALVQVTDWRGIFGVLAVGGVLLMAATARWVPETLPPGERQRGGLRSAGRTYLLLLRDRAFLVAILTGGLLFAALFSFITASPFIVQDGLGFSASLFGVLFAANAVGLWAGAWASSRVPLPIGMTTVLAGAVVVLLSATVLPQWVALIGFLPIAVGAGLTFPPLTVRAMTTTAGPAGAASALFGSAQFVIGGLVAPVASRGAGDRPVLLGVVATCAAALALGGVLLLRRGSER